MQDPHFDGLWMHAGERQMCLRELADCRQRQPSCDFDRTAEKSACRHGAEICEGTEVCCLRWKAQLARGKAARHLARRVPKRGVSNCEDINNAGKEQS